MLLQPLLAWNFCFVVGFMNQQIAVGLALLAAALEPRIVGRALATPVRAAFAAAITVVHPFGAAFYVGLLGAWCMSPGRATGETVRDLLRRIALPTIALSAVILTGPQPPGLDDQGIITSQPIYLGLGHKIAAALAPFATYAPLIEGVAGTLMLAGLAYAVRVGRLRADRGFVAASAFLAAMALLGPDNLGDAGSMGLRLSWLAVILLVVGVIPVPAPSTRLQEQIAALLLTGLVVARTAWLAQVWLGASTDARAVLAAVAHVPPGARLLAVLDLPDASLNALPVGRTILLHTTFNHYPLLAIPQARAFVPYLFTARSKQPVRVLPPFDRIATPDGGPVPLLDLLRSDRAGAEHSGTLGDWRAQFDHILMMSPMGQSNPPAGLEQIADEGFARLYRIVHPP